MKMAKKYAGKGDILILGSFNDYRHFFWFAQLLWLQVIQAKRLAQALIWSDARGSPAVDQESSGKSSLTGREGERERGREGEREKERVGEGRGWEGGQRERERGRESEGGTEGGREEERDRKRRSEPRCETDFTSLVTLEEGAVSTLLLTHVAVWCGGAG